MTFPNVSVVPVSMLQTSPILTKFSGSYFHTLTIVLNLTYESLILFINFRVLTIGIVFDRAMMLPYLTQCQFNAQGMTPDRKSVV